MTEQNPEQDPQEPQEATQEAEQAPAEGDAPAEAQDAPQEVAFSLPEDWRDRETPAGWSGELLPRFSPIQAPGPDLVANATNRVAAACGKRATTMGEDVDYAVGLTMVPNPQQNQMVPVITVVLAIRSAVIDQRIHLTTMIDNLWAEQDAYDNMVLQAVQQLVSARTSMMQQMAAQANGQGMPQGFGG